MSTTCEKAPTSLLRLGYARADITPPVGIYHRMWGAARHDAATGVHRPLQADIVVLESLQSGQRTVRLQLDFVGLDNEQTQRLVHCLVAATGVAEEQVLVTHSHSHAAGVFGANRRNLPGGDLIEPYLDELADKVEVLAAQAVADMAPATITYAQTRCKMAAHRDYWDGERGLYATGYNPDQDGEDQVLVARVCGEDGTIRLVLVNYACHPTTLAWDNTLISPDYVGALRQVVESDSGAPCCFYQAPCGELGPREGFVGDTEVADRNGRQVGHAALSALYGMGPPQMDFAYLGPVVSGATIGTWGWQEQDDGRRGQTTAFGGGSFRVPLDMIPLQTSEQLQADLERLSAEQAQADARGAVVEARDLGARAERCRRWLGRLPGLPASGPFPVGFSVHQFGDAVWITCSAEPYSWLASQLRRCFPQLTLMISPLAGDTQIAYLLPRESYGKGLYQEEPSALAPGCLEELAAAIGQQITALTGQQAVSGGQ
ncbi:MAG: hypothetical protein GKR89_33250 [Candidatus Latescibacteria bacterium]|nr:hypothetical protein [Candidatus Latescibacterota bacterium]